MDRLSSLHTDAYRGTIREQFGYRYAETAYKESNELYGDFGR